MTPNGRYSARDLPGRDLRQGGAQREWRRRDPGHMRMGEVARRARGLNQQRLITQEKLSVG